MTAPFDAAQLLDAAREARVHAHAPYSNFPVGAALLLADGRVVRGVNVENRTFGLTLCAERTAVASAVAAGDRGFVAIAISASHASPCPPCGACRQVMAEFAPDLPVVLEGVDGEPVVTHLGILLPMQFDLPPRP
ncbi:MAG: cytidine deaminase [Candidatus Sericytochromatia bacterium]|nr:cytidine deaminase [Candidatus Tanganyikabacteria bacterium]